MFTYTITCHMNARQARRVPHAPVLRVGGYSQSSTVNPVPPTPPEPLPALAAPKTDDATIIVILSDEPERRTSLHRIHFNQPNAIRNNTYAISTRISRTMNTYAKADLLCLSK